MEKRVFFINTSLTPDIKNGNTDRLDRSSIHFIHRGER